LSRRESILRIGDGPPPPASSPSSIDPFWPTLIRALIDEPQRLPGFVPPRRSARARAQPRSTWGGGGGGGEGGEGGGGRRARLPLAPRSLPATSPGERADPAAHRRHRRLRRVRDLLCGGGNRALAADRLALRGARRARTASAAGGGLVLNGRRSSRRMRARGGARPRPNTRSALALADDLARL